MGENEEDVQTTSEDGTIKGLVWSIHHSRTTFTMDSTPEGIVFEFEERCKGFLGMQSSRREKVRFPTADAGAWSHALLAAKGEISQESLDFIKSARDGKEMPNASNKGIYAPPSSPERADDPVSAPSTG